MAALIIASSCQDKLTRWEHGLRDVARISRVTSEFGLLKEHLVRVKPQILLLDHDFPGLGGTDGTAGLIRMSPGTRIIVMGGSLSCEIEYGLFKAGVRGCCRNDIDPQQLKRVVAAVQQGELWIRRRLTHRLLDDLNAASEIQPDPDFPGLAGKLTRREHEIAVLAGNGDTSKQIAENLAISERTVKSHLSEIYRKLGIAGRLELALTLAGDEHQSQRAAPVQRQAIRVSSGGLL